MIMKDTPGGPKMPLNKPYPPTAIGYADWNDLADNYAGKAATLIVDAGGKGGYTSIQEAVDALPTTNAGEILLEATLRFGTSIGAANLLFFSFGWARGGPTWNFSGNPASGIYIRFIPGSDTTFVLVANDGGSESNSGVGSVPIVVDTWYRVGIRLAADQAFESIVYRSHVESVSLAVRLQERRRQFDSDENTRLRRRPPHRLRHRGHGRR